MLPLLNGINHQWKRILRGARWVLRKPLEWWFLYRAWARLRGSEDGHRAPRTVVFVVDSVSSRACKLAYGLKSIGWKVTLLHRGDLPADPVRYFDKTVRFACAAEALFLATRYRPVAFHVFSNWNFDAAVLLVRHRLGKIVFDDYDVLGGTLLPHFAHRFRKAIKLERFVLENSDGLCCRDLETQAVKRAGYRFRGRRLLLLDCCWGGHPPDTVKASRAMPGFHIVNCGNMSVGTLGEYLVHRQELVALAGRLVAKGLAGRGIHFHDYPVHGFPAEALDLEGQRTEVAGVSVQFHLHQRVSPDRLTEELSQYDAGLYHTGLDADPPTYNHLKFIYTSGNRVFDYLDAGLPVIIHGSRFMEQVVGRAGADVRIESQLSPAALAFLRSGESDFFARQAARAREWLAVSRHAGKLAAFYGSL